MENAHLDTSGSMQISQIRQQAIREDLYWDAQSIKALQEIAFAEGIKLTFCPVIQQNVPVDARPPRFACLEEICSLETLARTSEFSYQLHAESVVILATAVDAAGTTVAIVWADEAHVGVLQYDPIAHRVVSIDPIFPVPNEGEIACCHAQYWKGGKAILLAFSTQYYEMGGMARILSWEDGVAAWTLIEPPLALPPDHEQNVQLCLDESNQRLYFWFLSDQNLCLIDLRDQQVRVSVHFPLVSALAQMNGELLVAGDKGKIWRLNPDHLQLEEDVLNHFGIYYPCVAMGYDPLSGILISVHPYCERLWEVNDHPGSRWGDVVFSEKNGHGWIPKICQPFESNPFNRSDSNMLFRIVSRDSGLRVISFFSSSNRSELQVSALRDHVHTGFPTLQLCSVDVTERFQPFIPKLEQHHTSNGIYIASDNAIYCAWL